MKKKIAIILVISIVFSSVGLTYGANASDLQNHWGREVIEEWMDEGFISGYPDGSFRPDKAITRAEFMVLVNKAFDFETEGSINFIDVANTDWYFDAIRVASASSYIEGYPDGSMKPNNPISRQEVTAILSKITNSQINSSVITSFTDANDIASWAKNSIEAAVLKGYMQGYPDGTFKPKNNITRAEAVVTLNKALTVKVDKEIVVYNKAGIYGPQTGITTITKDVIVASKGVTLQNMTIKGNLTIDEEVGTGDVYLNNITVEGITFIQGGGKDSIHIDGGSYNKVIVQRTSSGNVRIVATNIDGLEIIISEAAEGQAIILEGSFDSVTIDASYIDLVIQGETVINEFVINKGVKDLSVSLGNKTSIAKLLVNAKIEVTGRGTIKVASGKEVNNSTFEKAPDRIINSSSGGSSGSNGGGNPSRVAVSAITIIGNNTVVNGGTLQLGVTVTPVNATDKTVIWSVAPGTGLATINEDGLLTASALGTVTVSATNVDSGISGTKLITVTTVPNGSQLAPTGLTGVAPTAILNDGKITGTTVDMEYRLKGAIDFITVTGTEITSLAAGTYELRLAEKTGFTAGATAEVVIAAYAPPNQDQAAPTGLVGVAPTAALNYGKITGTTVDMEYKLVTAEDSTYATCSAVETIVAAGEYLVRFAAKSGFNAGTTVAVTVPKYTGVVGIELGQTAMTLRVGMATGTLIATVNPAEATDKTVIWSTSNKTVATVANGVVTPLAVGTTTITVTTLDGSHTATCYVTIIEEIIATIAGIDAPTIGVKPTTTISETDQYTGTVSWAPNDGVFVAGKEYSAIITLTGKGGLDLTEVTANYFTVPGAIATNAASSGVITAVFATMVASPADLYAVRNNIDGHYIQVADINLSVYDNWEPIGTGISAFSGNYNGNGYRISNLVINRVNYGYLGLFGSSTNAEFQNITLQNVNISGWSNLGGLIGYNEGSDITNCFIKGGSVTGSGYRIGGLVGFSKDSVIKNSNATCNVTAGEGDAGGLIGILFGSSSIIDSYATGNIIGLGNIGGLVGEIYNENTANITACYATGLVTTSGVNKWYAGGLIGLANGGTVISSSYATGNVSGNNGVGGLVGQATKIVNSYALGNVTGNGNRIGGLAGQNGGEIKNCFSTGTVTGSGDYRGGLIGFYNGTYVTLNSYYDKDISGFTSNDKGLARTTLQMKKGTANSKLDADGIASVTGDNIYTEWDSNVWNFGTDADYPSFDSKAPEQVTPAAPSVTNDDALNTVTGMATGMEYKLDSAAYVAYDATVFAAIDFNGVHILLVRVAAEGINPASAATTLTFTANPVPITPAAPSVTNDDALNSVTGMGTGMEYKLDEDDYVAYDATAFAAIDFSGAHILLVRVAAEGINPASAATTLTFTANTVPVTQYTLTLTGSDMTSNPVAGLIDENTPVTVTVAPAEGQQVATFTVGGVDKKADLVAGVYTFAITADTRVAVTYEAISSTQYTLTLTGAKITSDPVAGLIDENTPVTVTVAPAEGQQVATFRVGGVDKKADLVAGGYTFTITADTTVNSVIKLTQVAKPIWIGNVIYWIDIDDELEYMVSIYKDGVQLNTHLADPNATSYDCTSQINNNGAGSYTVEVRANANTAVGFDHGDFSGQSDANEVNNATFTGAVWDYNTVLLTLTLQNVQHGSSFDLTKLSYYDSTGMHTLVGPYNQVSNQMDVETTNYGKYYFDSGNNKLIINLTEYDFNATSLPESGGSSYKVSAISGWNTYIGIDAGFVAPKDVTIQY